MGRLLVAALVLMSCDQVKAALGRAEPPPPQTPAPAPKPVVVWQAISVSGAAKMAQTNTGDACRTRCAVGANERWANPSCLAERDDFVFVTDDCSSAIVVAASPPATRSWASMPVLFRYDHGKLTRSYPAEPMLSGAAVKRVDGRYRWLKGEPKYLHNGAGISFEVLSGRVTRLPFQDGDRVNVETYVNDRPSQPEAPTRAEPAPNPEGLVVMTSPSDASVTVRTESTTTQVLTRVCDATGCRYEPAQGPPTLRSENGEGFVCRNESEDCGNNADCCGGHCSEGKCR